MKRELLLGCGNSRDKKLFLVEGEKSFSNLTTLDHDPDCKPDYLWDLNDLPYPIEDNSFDEIHAYQVLEHLGRQGDYVAFFAQFSEFWRILKPGGLFFASVPSLRSVWLWSDPGHTRVISNEMLVFLSQKEYAKQVGNSDMTDYRHIYKADFDRVSLKDDGEAFMFVIRAVKGGAE